MPAVSNATSLTDWITLPPPQDWCVYIIETTTGHFYTGITNNLPRRAHQHRTGRGAKYFRLHPPKAVVWTETEHTRSSASQREYAIKQLSRQQKRRLISDTQTHPITIPATPEG
ncbi:GIY-YIG nuclease family protein [Marinibactrum halimedae]|uniref:GIY-YIG domain-containing protein n=1 Tax=Marinibactrum halimedae TaxID=1444977 RepID=A0AA37WNR4_9GAMM|nr:GIY-YIG nuclease family protein [Marinibactrum halimedae]MCD9461199.1 GIY-YIG nuclease family protein [Marinibactrum halimedae]GLS26421.1 hypothetical protein GCM10007877_21370 [Marinibactrum halimedae]